MLHLLNPADRAEQVRFLERQDKEREEKMNKPSIYIAVRGGTVQQVRATHDLETANIVVFDHDDVEADQGEDEVTGKLEPLGKVEERLYGMTWADAVEHSKEVW